ncbi:putative lipid II flippase FtsW [Anaerotignum sp. MB30-C6]|uniref:putative lipid II flippase FtsW n=1 Tax=Anaerotignum sp. MB30-C6 TaxID=3070814 RepID=UPI0027DB4B52|nr:putative lipid II flippase FtsW [Anaerotignum sp. MB30-C6]WMI80366.1 putative lipid II flippase FtsW [Anaerotignum sp. MB30-C6]
MGRSNSQRKATTAKRKRIKPDSFDFTVLFVVLTLMLFGVVMIFSASYYTTMTTAKYDYDMFYFLKRQSVWVVLGTIAMIFCMNIPYNFWRRFALLAYWLSNFFLLLLPFIGIEAGGQKRWLGVGMLQFQPSEFTKLALVLYLSHYIVTNRQDLANIRGFFKALMVLALPVGLIAISNFSSALLILLMGLTILFIGSPRIWYFIAGAVAIIPAAVLAIVVFPYRLSRIKVWLDPWSDPTNKGFQTIQGLYAVASGGIFGLGLGQSRQKTFVPESHNDIIFAIICEELGIIGAALVIILFAVLIWRGIKIAMNAKDTYGTLMATGITSVIAFQAIINIGVVTNTIPNTGQPLPFISYGGTSLLFLTIMVGLLLNISRYQKE